MCRDAGPDWPSSCLSRSQSPRQRSSCPKTCLAFWQRLAMLPRSLRHLSWQSARRACQPKSSAPHVRLFLVSLKAVHLTIVYIEAGSTPLQPRLLRLQQRHRQPVPPLPKQSPLRPPPRPLSRPARSPVPPCLLTGLCHLWPQHRPAIPLRPLPCL